MRELGRGSFGVVSEGVLLNWEPGRPKLTVAIKVAERLASARSTQALAGDASRQQGVQSNALPQGGDFDEVSVAHAERLKSHCTLTRCRLFSNFDHPNIVRLLGVCLCEERGEQVLVLEYMEGGDLHHFLRDCRHAERQRAKAPIVIMGDLIAAMIDVCRGCAYLEVRQLERKHTAYARLIKANRHVHRDLAARNCLISSRASSARVTKIGERCERLACVAERRCRFQRTLAWHASSIRATTTGELSQKKEVASTRQAVERFSLSGEDFLPLRWLSPEAAHEGLFTSKSDVWSYAVLVCELLTLGERPFGNLSNSVVLEQLREGKHPTQPKACPDEM